MAQFNMDHSREAEYNALKLNQVQQQCGLRHLNSHGRKIDLIKSLMINDYALAHPLQGQPADHPVPPHVALPGAVAPVAPVMVPVPPVMAAPDMQAFMQAFMAAAAAAAPAAPAVPMVLLPPAVAQPPVGAPVVPTDWAAFMARLHVAPPPVAPPPAAPPPVAPTADDLRHMIPRPTASANEALVLAQARELAELKAKVDELSRQQQAPGRPVTDRLDRHSREHQIQTLLEDDDDDQPREARPQRGTSLQELLHPSDQTLFGDQGSNATRGLHLYPTGSNSKAFVSPSLPFSAAQVALLKREFECAVSRENASAHVAGVRSDNRLFRSEALAHLAHSNTISRQLDAATRLAALTGQMRSGAMQAPQALLDELEAIGVSILRAIALALQALMCSTSMREIAWRAQNWLARDFFFTQHFDTATAGGAQESQLTSSITLLINKAVATVSPERPLCIALDSNRIAMASVPSAVIPAAPPAPAPSGASGAPSVLAIRNPPGPDYMCYNCNLKGRHYRNECPNPPARTRDRDRDRGFGERQEEYARMNVDRDYAQEQRRRQARRSRSRSRSPAARKRT